MILLFCFFEFCFEKNLNVYRTYFYVGKRFVHNETGFFDEEYEILSDYLSKCVLDSANHCLNLPSSDFPEGFKCSFYRASEEKFYSCEGDKNETFTVIILDEKGWDSDCSDKREQKQVCCEILLYFPSFTPNF